MRLFLKIEMMHDLMHFNVIFLQLVSAAKVPVLKLTDSKTSLEGDINVNCYRNIRHTYLLRSYVLLDHRVQPLGLIVKLWAKKAGIINQRDHKLSGIVLQKVYY